MGYEESSLRVAFCGLGNLGGPICDALVASPHIVAVFDPRREVVEPRVARGARPAISAADAARDADAMIVMVRDDAQVHEVVFGELGLLATAPTGSVLVLHSTVAPDTVRRVHAATVAAGVRFVDAGISTGGGRSIGEMYVMCGEIGRAHV